MRTEGFRLQTIMTCALGVGFQLSWLHDLGMLAWLVYWKTLAPTQFNALLNAAILALVQVTLGAGLLFHQPWARTASVVLLVSAAVRIAFADTAPEPSTMMLGLAAFFAAGLLVQEAYRGRARRRFRSLRVGAPRWPALANEARGVPMQAWIGQRDSVAEQMEYLEQMLDQSRNQQQKKDPG